LLAEDIGLACIAYNSTVHETTGYAHIELSSTSDPCPNVWTRQPSSISKNPASKSNFRLQILARAAKFRESAGEKMAPQLERYKKLYDAHARRRHHDLEIGDSVFVNTHVFKTARSSKLCFPVAGLYPVIRVDGSNVDIRTREGPQRLHMDYVVRYPTTLPSGES
jgi:hypothetical protein